MPLSLSAAAGRALPLAAGILAATLSLTAGHWTAQAAAKPEQEPSQTLAAAKAVPLSVHLDYRSFARRINAIQLDCKVFDPDGHQVGRGTLDWKTDPAYLHQTGSVDATVPVILTAGTDMTAAQTCDCTARFDTRSLLFRSGDDRFGRLPWMLARSYRFAEQSCQPGVEEMASRQP